MATLPVVAPAHHRDPAIKRKAQMEVWEMVMNVRRPNLSVVTVHKLTARRLQQLVAGRLGLVLDKEVRCIMHKVRLTKG